MIEDSGVRGIYIVELFVRRDKHRECKNLVGLFRSRMRPIVRANKGTIVHSVKANTCMQLMFVIGKAGLLDEIKGIHGVRKVEFEEIPPINE